MPRTGHRKTAFTKASSDPTSNTIGFFTFPEAPSIRFEMPYRYLVKNATDLFPPQPCPPP